MPKYQFTQISARKLKKYMKRISNFNSSDWEKLLMKNAKANLSLKKYLILAVSNNGNFEFVLNLIASLKLNNYTKFLKEGQSRSEFFLFKGQL